jgi:transposase
MGKPHPIELRERVVAFVDEGHGHREAARHFPVSPKFVNELIKLRRETGSLKPRPQGNGGGHGKLAGVTGWIEARIAAKGEMSKASPKLIFVNVARLAALYRFSRGA